MQKGKKGVIIDLQKIIVMLLDRNASGLQTDWNLTRKVSGFFSIHVCFSLLLHSLCAGWLPLSLSSLGRILYPHSLNSYVTSSSHMRRLKWFVSKSQFEIPEREGEKEIKRIWSVQLAATAYHNSNKLPPLKESYCTNMAARADFKAGRWSLGTVQTLWKVSTTHVQKRT